MKNWYTVVAKVCVKKGVLVLYTVLLKKLGIKKKQFIKQGCFIKIKMHL